MLKRVPAEAAVKSTGLQQEHGLTPRVSLFPEAAGGQWGSPPASSVAVTPSWRKTSSELHGLLLTALLNGICI